MAMSSENDGMMRANTTQQSEDEVFTGVPSYYSDGQYLMEPDDYSQDSKKAEYIEAMYAEKAKHESYFPRQSYLLDDSDAVIDLTGKGSSDDMDPIQMGKDGSFDSNIDEYIAKDRPHSEFFQGNLNLAGKIVAEEGSEAEIESPIVFDYQQQLNILEKSMPIMGLGESGDSMGPENYAQSKFTFL